MAESFTDRDLSHARFTRCDLSNVTMRAVDLTGADLDAPWLLEGPGTLLVNGVDVAPFVEAELNRRFPGRAERRATTPEELRTAWDAVQGAWDATVARVAAMPPGTADVSVDGEWSFAQTLRHLVMATDVWFGRTILDLPNPLHPIGQPNVEFAMDGHDISIFSETDPSFERVLEVRAQRAAMVREFLADVTPERLAQERPDPWAPSEVETVGSCLRVILEEEWEHLRFARRDLDRIESEAPVT